MNTMNILSRAKQVYLNNVSNVIFCTTGLGLLIGLGEEMVCAKYNPPNVRFNNIVGMTTVGFVSGLTFPVSFPLMGICVLSSSYKENASKKPAKN